MQVSTVSFGNISQIQSKSEQMQNLEVTRIYKHWIETGDFKPALDYYNGIKPKINYNQGVEQTSAKTPKSNNVFSNMKCFFKRIIKK